jgi:hypothetical protein
MKRSTPGKLPIQMREILVAERAAASRTSRYTRIAWSKRSASNHRTVSS